MHNFALYFCNQHRKNKYGPSDAPFSAWLWTKRGTLILKEENMYICPNSWEDLFWEKKLGAAGEKQLLFAL